MLSLGIKIPHATPCSPPKKEKIIVSESEWGLRDHLSTYCAEEKAEAQRGEGLAQGWRSRWSFRTRRAFT